MNNRTLPDWNVKLDWWEFFTDEYGNRTLPDWNVKTVQISLFLY